jgi:hypothetical protein
LQDAARTFGWPWTQQQLDQCRRVAETAGWGLSELVGFLNAVASQDEAASNPVALLERSVLRGI